MGIGACFGFQPRPEGEVAPCTAHVNAYVSHDFGSDAGQQPLLQPTPDPQCKPQPQDGVASTAVMGTGVDNYRVGLQLAGLDMEMGDSPHGSRVVMPGRSQLGNDPVEGVGEQHFQPMHSDSCANVIQIARMDDLDDDGLVQVTNHVEVSVESDGIKRFNQYVALALLGKGSFGKVKLVVRDGADTYKAMRTLRRYKTTDIQKEINTVRTLKHENLVRLCEVLHDTQKKKVHLVMDFFENGPIAEVQRDGVVRCRKPYDVVRLRRHVCQIGSGLTYLHKQHITHHDVKPSNVLLDARDVVKLSDFGFSHNLLDSDAMPGELEGGLPAFVSPEDITGAKDSGHAVDMWALGVMVYCLVYRRLPFFGDTADDLKDAIRSKTPTFEGHDPEIADLMEKMLQKDWRKRLGEPAFWQHPFVCMPGTAHYDPLAISVGDLDNRGPLTDNPL
eukprot:GGOE01061750.1.p1 GENE.GGOE01061750.1~~GGOE01061750.1.p1  ORF type:complete len:445 (+),score=98.75 GGOE01061750.1:81-1415(+)